MRGKFSFLWVIAILFVYTLTSCGSENVSPASCLVYDYVDFKGTLVRVVYDSKDRVVRLEKQLGDSLWSEAFTYKNNKLDEKRTYNGIGTLLKTEKFRFAGDSAIVSVSGGSEGYRLYFDEKGKTIRKVQDTGDEVRFVYNSLGNLESETHYTPDGKLSFELRFFMGNGGQPFYKTPYSGLIFGPEFSCPNRTERINYETGGHRFEERFQNRYSDSGLLEEVEASRYKDGKLQKKLPRQFFLYSCD
ncbi:hypothetical protein FUAX_16590 [Fulvitalea axinellae]|uniref:YD repeat-containing protein n=1 Tax=Fulvitalea axinellae TaxID=1182444 RepID=A0AAU9CQI8_9BACT|nr:hypothetical protein FUAX_16590 [Fulvitalea axinellae]